MKFYGTFIGIDRYQDPNINTLQFAAADAEKLHNLIAANLLPDETRLWLFTNEQATKQKITKTVGETLSRIASREDIVLLYFSGHGSPETSSSRDTISRYLVTHDTEYEAIFATAIDVERDLTRLVERITANLIIVVLDTCFSGRAGGRTFEGPHLIRSRAHWRQAVELSNLKLGKGRAILAACDEDEVAYESPVLKQGIFTYYLIQALTDANTSLSWISLSELYEQVAQQVYHYTKGRQNPILNGRLKMARLPRLRKYVEGD